MSEYKAINVNSLSGNAFPVSVDYRVKDDVKLIYLTPISVLEVLDLLPANTFLIFNVDTYEFDENKTPTLSEVVSKHSAYLKKFDEETLLIEKQSLLELLEVTPHYNFNLIQAEREIEIEKVIEIFDYADRWNETTVIDKVGSNVFLSSHDDCYLYVETNDENLALDLISLLIKTLVSTALNCSIGDLRFDAKDLITNKEFSIVIPQNSIKTPEKVSWKIFEATFRDFIYNRESINSSADLIYFEDGKTIQIKKVRSDETSD